MKKILFSIFVVLLCYCTDTLAQCPSGPVILITQQDINDFVTTYPNCTEIEGRLEIRGAVNDLSPLSQITAVGVDLWLLNNNILPNLQGLENLTTIGRSLWIYQSNGVTDLTGLENITSVPGELRIGRNSSLTNLTGLNNLTSVGTWVWIEDNNNLIGLNDLGNLMTIGDYLWIESNDKLTNLTGLENLSSIGSSLEIKDNNSLVDLTGLQNLTSIPTYLQILENNTLTSLNGLNNLNTIGTSLVIGENNWLNDLTVLQNISSLGDRLSIFANNSLSSLQGLNNIVSVANFVVIDDNPLTDLQGLESLNSIGSFLKIQDNDLITNLNGLASLNTIQGDLSIRYNNVLTDITGIENINYTDITDLHINQNPQLSVCEVSNICDYLDNNGSVTITGNALGCISLEQVSNACMGIGVCPDDIVFSSQQEVDDFAAAYPYCTEIPGDVTITGADIANIDGLTQLTSIGGNLTITSTDIFDVYGLMNIVNVGGSIEISNNIMLTEITYLQDILSVGGDLSILNNPLLASLRGLENIDETTINNLEIDGNAQLAICGFPNICNYLSTGGTAAISANALGCDSSQEVQAVCSECPDSDVHLLTQADVNQFIVLYPNCTQLLYSLTIDDDFDYSGINDLSPLSKLTAIDGNLNIENADSLTNLTGLDNLAFVGGRLIIDYNLNLSDLAALNSLLFVGKDLNIIYNPNLNNLIGLDNLTRIGRDLYVAFSHGFADFVGLNNLSSIGNGLRIQDNHGLVDLSGLENLTLVQGYISIYANTLSTLKGLENLTSTTYSGISISNNPYLSSLSGLENLTSIGYSLNIINNDTLTTLEGLDNLVSISGPLQITDNANLNDLNGIANIDHTTISELLIYDNPNLSVCYVESVCNYLSDDGDFDIQNNMMGCNSDAEIESSCIALPIENVAPFQVYLKGSNAELTWKTATETNNKGFEIQRSKDGIDWETIAWQPGQGNTLTPHSYAYTDEKPLSGTSYYRLKQVDFSGDFSYTNIVSLTYIRPQVSISPNPGRGIFNIGLSQGTYQILNTAGQVIQTGNLKNNTQIDISHEPKGVYFISITIDDYSIIERIVKI